MHRKFATCLFVFVLGSPVAIAQTPSSVASESRDAALGYLGTTNFLIGRIGRDCLTVLGRREPPREFVRVWQSHNAVYITAMAKYMDKRFSEVIETSGVEQRIRVEQEMLTKAQANVDATFQGWFREGTKEQVCKRIVGLVDSGAMNISTNSPMFKELQELVLWAQ